jgi:hypothetical protein
VARALVAALLGLVLAGCGSLGEGGLQTGFDISFDGKVVKVVSRVPGLDPYPVAEEYCAARGLLPRPLSLTETRAVVACDPKA